MEYQEHKLNERTDNFIRTVEFRSPKWIPVQIEFLPAAWFKNGEILEKIVLEHPKFFPDYRKGDFLTIDNPWYYRKGRHKDIWGITWENIEDGFAGAPVEADAPLKNWADIKNYIPPDPRQLDWLHPETIIDWETRRKRFERTKITGGIAQAGLHHGFIYMWQYYLRGFSNFMMDVANRNPALDQLSEIIVDYNLKLVQKWLEIGAEIFYFGDDMGLQKSLPISPNDWRRNIKPGYRRILGACKDAGALTYLHSDGHILEIIDDLVECGLNIINPQARANGLKGLSAFRGKVCIHLDLDRQLFPFATPEQIRDHLSKAIDVLCLPEGGLMLNVEIAPDVPPANLEAILEFMEKHGCGLWHG